MRPPFSALPLELRIADVDGVVIIRSEPQFVRLFQTERVVAERLAGDAVLRQHLGDWHRRDLLARFVAEQQSKHPDGYFQLRFSEAERADDRFPRMTWLTTELQTHRIDLVREPRPRMLL